MTAYNVAVTVGPTIFRPKKHRQEDITKLGVYYSAFIIMIENCEELFKDDA